MQAEIYPDVPITDLSKKLQEMVETPVQYDEKRMLKALEDERVKCVRVYRLKRKKRNKQAKKSRRGNR